MPTPLFHKIIDELAEIDFYGRISPHFFGEPLLDARLVDLLRYAKKKLPKSQIVVLAAAVYITFDAGQEFRAYYPLKRPYVAACFGSSDFLFSGKDNNS